MTALFSLNPPFSLIFTSTVHVLFKFVAVRHRRRAKNTGNFPFHTEFPHTTHTASSSNIYLISDTENTIGQNCFTLSLFYREFFDEYLFILKLSTAYLLDRQHCFCDTAFSAILIVELYSRQTGQAHNIEALLMTVLSRKNIVLKKLELLITISKTYNFHVEKKTVIQKYLQFVSL